MPRKPGFAARTLASERISASKAACLSRESVRHTLKKIVSVIVSPRHRLGRLAGKKCSHSTTLVICAEKARRSLLRAPRSQTAQDWYWLRLHASGLQPIGG